MIDEPLFKSLAHTFHIIAETEEENIINRNFDEPLAQEKRKSVKKRDMKKQEKEELEETKEPRAQTAFISNSVNQRKLKNMIPGFSIIKNRIITPLLIASERVVEYMIPDREDSSSAITQKAEINDLVQDQEVEHSLLSSKMEKMTLEDLDRRQRKRTLKCLRKSDQTISISKNLMNKASDCVDYISDRMPMESKVTRNFVTNMIELSDSALKRIATSCKGIDETSGNINMRFIKPSKKFYNLLMSVWVKMDTTSILHLTETGFIDMVKQALEKEELVWTDAYVEPTNTFFNVAKEEFISQYKAQKEDDNLDVEPTNIVFSMSRFFTSIKSTLLEMWNSEIVSKSANFTSASITNESEEGGVGSDIKREQKEDVQE